MKKTKNPLKSNLFYLFFPIEIDFPTSQFFHKRCKMKNLKRSVKKISSIYHHPPQPDQYQTIKSDLLICVHIFIHSHAHPVIALSLYRLLCVYMHVI